MKLDSDTSIRLSRKGGDGVDGERREKNTCSLLLREGFVDEPAIREDPDELR